MVPAIVSINIQRIHFWHMSYKLLDHATDAIIQVTARDLNEAFSVAGQAVADITLDSRSVGSNEERRIAVTADDLQYLLFNWLEAVIYLLITEGFAINKIIATITKNKQYNLEATAQGEPIDLKKHGFKVEIKAPTFHEMEISQNSNVSMKFLLDL